LKQLKDEDMEKIVEVQKNIEDDVPIKGEGNVTPHF
jgi:hypothetical protein